MSDALTDMARDESRGRLFTSFLASVFDFLQEPTEERKNLALQITISCDDVPRPRCSKYHVNMAPQSV